MQKTVTIEIDEAGESSIDLVGFQGKGCADVAKAFQGSDAVTHSEKKREFDVYEKLTNIIRKIN